MRFFVFLLIIFLNLSLASAEWKDQVSFWRNKVEHVSLAELAKLISDPELPKWPCIESEYAYSRGLIDQQVVGDDALQLAEKLRSNLEATFHNGSDPNESEMKSSLNNLAIVKHAISEAGGYSNQVLQDSINRVMIFYFANWLITHPSKINEVDSLLDMISVQKVDIKLLFENMANQDGDLVLKIESFSAIDSTKTIYEALAPIGLSMNDVLAFADPSKLRTSELLKRPSVPMLVYRMAATESLKSINLKGMIDFLKLGGKFEELDPADIRKFEMRMGKESRKYQYTLFGIRALTEAHINALIDLQRDSDLRRTYLNITLK